MKILKKIILLILITGRPSFAAQEASPETLLDMHDFELKLIMQRISDLDLKTCSGYSYFLSVEQAIGRLCQLRRVNTGFKKYLTSQKIAEILLRQGLDVHATNEKGKTVLHYAATACAYSFYQLKFESERSAECIAVLIAAGAGPNAVSNKGKAALHQAARCGNTSSAKILLKAGANINAKDKAGKSALHYASFYAAETLRMLLAEGADVHDEDLLECAAKGCSHRDTSMARLLVDYYNKNEREIPKGAIPNLEALGIKILHD